MSWFKVDDKFYSWKELLGIPRSIRAEAAGLWTLAGTWSADHLTDGKIPVHMIEELAGSIAAADALVAAKLWKKSRGNYQFVKWSKDQPTRTQVEQRREEERDRKAAYRQRMAESRGETGQSPENVPAGQSPVPNPPSRSRPDPINNQDLTGHHQLRNGGTTGDNPVQPVDKYLAALEAAQANLSKLTGQEVERIQATVVVDHVLGKASRGRPVADPTKYVLRAIAQDKIGFERFVFEGRLPD